MRLTHRAAQPERRGLLSPAWRGTGGEAARARQAEAAALQDNIRQMQKLMATLSSQKESIARATAFAVQHAKRGGASALTEVVATRLQEVRVRLTPPYDQPQPKDLGPEL